MQIVQCAEHNELASIEFERDSKQIENSSPDMTSYLSYNYDALCTLWWTMFKHRRALSQVLTIDETVMLFFPTQMRKGVHKCWFVQTETTNGCNCNDDCPIYPDCPICFS